MQGQPALLHRQGQSAPLSPHIVSVPSSPGLAISPREPGKGEATDSGKGEARGEAKSDASKTLASPKTVSFMFGLPEPLALSMSCCEPT
jgi:hypothetical protein